MEAASSPPVSEFSSQPVNMGVSSEIPPTDTKPRYKSYRKKYKKMQIRFQELLAKSKELQREAQRARRILNRIYRETVQVGDTLLDLNSAEEYPARYKISMENEESSMDSNTQLPLEAQQYLSLFDHAAEFSSDDDVLSVNPMMASEWLKRNHVMGPVDAVASKRKTSQPVNEMRDNKRLKEDSQAVS
jgi:hypothetical protein